MSDVAKPGENTGHGDRAPASGGDAGERHAGQPHLDRQVRRDEQVARRVVDMLAIHNEKLDAILEAATREPGPSPVFGVLTEILESLRAQESLLAELPDTLAETIRDEWQREPDMDDEPNAEDPETEPAGPGPFDGRTPERH